MHATGTPTPAQIGPRTLEGGTDGGSMLLFDPMALPEDVDRKTRDGNVGDMLDELTKAGRLLWLNTDGDGGYSLAVCLAEALPPALEPHARLNETVAALHVPSGQLYFTGVEYVFRQDDSALRKYPHMGGSIDVPAGVYRMDVYDLEYPEDFHETILRQRVTKSVARTYAFFNWLAAAAVFAGFVAVVSGFILRTSVWATTVLPGAATIIAVTILVSRSGHYRRAAEAYREIGREYPGYAVLLRPTEPSARE